MDFYDHTPRQFFNYLKGVRFRESENAKLTLENHRRLCMYLIMPYYDTKKHGKLTADKVMQFPWDNEMVQNIKKETKKQKVDSDSFWGRVGNMKKI